MTQVQAKLNGVRLAPRKVRAVANLVKGKSVAAALDQLEHLVKKPTSAIQKLINSGISNAEHNFNLVRSNLYIKNIIVDEGIKLKRFMPRGFGRAGMIQKKTSRITVVLDEKVPGMKQAAPQHKDKDKEIREVEAPTMETKKPEIKRQEGKKSQTRGLGNLKKLFNRKTIG